LDRQLQKPHWPWRWNNHFPSKGREPLTCRHGVTSQKTWILNNTAVRNKISCNACRTLCSSDRPSWEASYKTTNLMHQISKTLFCHKTLRVSDTFCAQHQELSTVHTEIGIFHAGYVTAS
jgi:hypothetical protein